MPQCTIGVTPNGQLATDCDTNIRDSPIRPIYSDVFDYVITQVNLETEFDDRTLELIMVYIVSRIFRITPHDIKNSDGTSLSDQIWCQGSVDVNDLPQSSPIERVGFTYAVFPCRPRIVPALAVYTRQWSTELVNLAIAARTLGVPLIRLSPNADRPVVSFQHLSDVRLAMRNFWRVIAELAIISEYYDVVEEHRHDNGVDNDDYYL